MRISDWSSDVCSSDLCDAHRIDAMFCILIQTTHGDIMPVIVPRLWVLVIQDVVSRVVLGYYLSFNKECNESDLLKCIQRALSSWSPRALEGTRLSYQQESGFPDKLDPQSIGAGRSEERRVGKGGGRT